MSIQGSEGCRSSGPTRDSSSSWWRRRHAAVEIRRCFSEFGATAVLTTMALGSVFVSRRLFPYESEARMAFSLVALTTALSAFFVLVPVVQVSVNPVVAVAEWMLERRSGPTFTRTVLRVTTQQFGAIAATALVGSIAAGHSTRVISRNPGALEVFAEFLTAGGFVALALALVTRRLVSAVVLGSYLAISASWVGAQFLGNPALVVGYLFLADSTLALLDASVIMTAQLGGCIIGFGLVTGLLPMTADRFDATARSARRTIGG
ncbi:MULTISPECIES: hypothetical protein [unclassified Nocardia]|uniref:hypothetical protein n=1 Tax=unclassified Nocardia TaxID=2637762 RepID=UPI0024A9D2D4|nr:MULTISPECIES: hypothetical protein [unclassified Nocardia]